MLTIKLSHTITAPRLKKTLRYGIPRLCIRTRLCHKPRRKIVQYEVIPIAMDCFDPVFNLISSMSVKKGVWKDIHVGFVFLATAYTNARKN